MSEMICPTQDWEQAIKQIKSVIAARIKVNNQGEIEEVHILSGSGRAPKQIVRDVESILVAQFNLQIDHKKISVAQVEDDEEVTIAMVESKRPKLVGVTLRTVNGMAEVKVELLTGDKLIEGVAKGPSSSHNKLRLFVKATLNALNPLTSDTLLFVTDDVGITQLAKQQIALVSITLIAPTGEQSLTGCALVRNDDREAVVKATLDAVNRKLKFLRND
ncbi:hypothetical protein [Desulfosporosinus sp. BICA1-9]|uniref:hypothetical protein n=1 Tax=Desulfosporosinus sp. BICA1-9 TaxID=1531958 RepID=UPI00054B929F|nr:hypothetical protein [Desulfosporosinus sp. BICA1-9]KJS48566.1 MAG: hypothetical protein VR66_13300 [Peptococcaceae bacterium BRH_c23]KJS81154.1 MAG: hypothetical protein JL57_27105 [Desulfosporosinus sp. BICA1-9]HBW38866.1 hypothetical protein [Desulfosporosinus sp.]